MSGYVLLFVLLVRLLRTRQSLERHAVLDALTVCLALGLASVLLLALPALDIPGRPPVELSVNPYVPSTSALRRLPQAVAIASGSVSRQAAKQRSQRCQPLGRARFGCGPY